MENKILLWLVPAFVLAQAFQVSGQSSDWLPLDKGLRCDEIAFFGINYLTTDTINNIIYASGPGISDGYCNDIGEIAMWDNNQWSSVGFGGLGATLVSSSATIFQENLITTGPFVHASGNAPWSWTNVWNGVEWDTIPGGPNRQVFDYLEYQEKLYAAGRFDYCGGANTGIGCVYDGETWEPLEVIPEFAGATYTVAEYQDEIYYGGNMHFTNELGESIDFLCKWDGEHFVDVAQGLADDYSFAIVEDFAVLHDTLYIAGQIKLPGDENIHWLVTYDGNTLQPADPMPNDEVLRLKVHDNAIYASGGFTEIGEVAAEHLARYDGIEWIAINTDSAFRKNDVYMGFQYSTTFRDIAIMNDTLYACGGFYRLNEDTLRHVAKLNKNLTTDFPAPATHTQEIEIDEFDFELYPNPSAGSLAFSWSQPEAGEVGYRISDTRGRVVKHSPPAYYHAGKHKKTLSLEHLSGGTYFIRLISPGGLTTKRWVKLE